MGHPEVPADGCDVRQTEDDPRTLEQRAGAGAAAARQRATRPDDLLHDHDQEKLGAAVKHDVGSRKDSPSPIHRSSSMDREPLANPCGFQLLSGYLVADHLAKTSLWSALSTLLFVPGSQLAQKSVLAVVFDVKRIRRTVKTQRHERAGKKRLSV
jgi:hypothetical protein